MDRLFDRIIWLGMLIIGVGAVVGCLQVIVEFASIDISKVFPIQ